MIRFVFASLLFVLFQACSTQPSAESRKAQNQEALEVFIDSARAENFVGLKVLGTAQDAGYPQISCEKACCKAYWSGSRPKETATSLGLIDRQQRKVWLFEATPDIIDQWKRLKEECYECEMAGIFLTHAHMGHYAGLMQLGREAMGAKGIPVYAMPRMREYLTHNGPWSQLVSLGNIKLVPLEAEMETTLSPHLKVKPFLVPHRDEFSETVGFSISGPGRKAMFIPDIDKWSKWDQSIEEKVSEHNLSFLDGTFYNENELPGRNMSEIPHPFILESLQTFQQLSEPHKSGVHFIHFNHTNPLLHPSSPESKAVLKAGFSIARSEQMYGL